MGDLLRLAEIPIWIRSVNLIYLFQKVDIYLAGLLAFPVDGTQCTHSPHEPLGRLKNSRDLLICATYEP